MADAKMFQLKLTEDAHEQLAVAARKRGVSMQAYATSAIEAILQQDAALEIAAQCLEEYGPAFGMDPDAVAAKAAELRAGDRLAA